MDYAEFKNCIDVLAAKPKWFRQNAGRALKLDCLETFRIKGSPSNIHALMPFLKSTDEIIRQRTAEVIVSLFDKLKSQNQLYSSLKYVKIDLTDIDFYSQEFAPNISVMLLALSSLNHSGYVRQRAVEALAVTKDVKAMRFIIIRLSDWVENVRDVAAISIRKYFTDEYREQFIRDLEYIEAIKNVGRVDLTTTYRSILNFVLEKRLNAENYKSLVVPQRPRLLFVNAYIENNGIDSELAKILISDKSFLIRIKVLKHLKEVNSSDQDRIILMLLNDRSSQVRLQALYSLSGDYIQYYDTILKLTSDLSAAVRDLSRYLLQANDINFREMYRQRIGVDVNKLGSILGLAEVGTVDDLVLLKILIESEDKKTRLASLIGIQKLDVQRAKIYALKYFTDEPNSLRKRSLQILSRTWDREVMMEMERVYVNADSIVKKMILILYSRVGGWDVLGLLINAVSDDDRDVRELGWSFLQKWKDKALRLFTTPSAEASAKAKQYYESTRFDLLTISQSKQKLWTEIRYYL